MTIIDENDLIVVQYPPWLAKLESNHNERIVHIPHNFSEKP